MEKAKAGENCTLIKGDSLETLSRLGKQNKIFDLIFSDPPYNKGLNEKVVKKLLEYPLLTPGGLLALEHSLEEDPTSYVPPDLPLRTEKYGETKISLIQWK